MIMYYNGSEAEGREAFKDLLAIGPVLDRLAEVPYEVVNSLLVSNLFHSAPISHSY